MNFKTANEKLQGRCSKRRKIANNTYLERREDGSIAVRLHYTDIIIFFPNGDTVLDASNWHTFTTKARMNEFMSTGWHVYQKNYNWYLRNYTTGQEVDFVNYIKITSNGRVISPKQA
jgi:hypothetical protein